MAKQGMHENDHNDNNVSKGPNNPDKSVTVTTGSPKKQETYARQAREHKDTGKTAQHDKNEWQSDTHHAPSRKDQRGDD
ncbi:MAG: hypothetical protein JWP00_4947 [Chloroflexi bacterium]|jgi:hypothetical protein|nr:hypothetical protein [Chloroflexota bacterium]